MKKNLLFIILPALLISASVNAQIKYWDFGAKELGDGYDNMLPEFYLNAWANYLRQIDLTYGDQTFTVDEGFVDESDESTESIYFSTFNSNYADYATNKFQLTSRGSAPTPPGGTLLSGGSEYTKPKNLPDLDGSIDMVFARDSNSDRLITVNKDLTRYDERNAMPDDVDPNEYPGAVQFTTPGAKRYQSTGRFRGFLMNLQANQYLTVVGSGQYTDIEGDRSLGCSTGWFSFETVGGTNAPVTIENKGDGTGASDCSGLDGGDTGDEAVRVMEFLAPSTDTYRLANRGGTIRVYRMYVSNTSIKSEVEATLSAEDFTAEATTQLKAIGNKIVVSNVTSETSVNIYSISGALVKSVTTDQDTSFEMQPGLWIATFKNANGTKSVKILTR